MALFVLSMDGTGVFSLEQELNEDGPYDSEDLNELEVNGNWTPQEKALHEARLKAKAKRRLRKSSSRDSTRESLSESVSGELSTDPHSPKGKNAVNDRKSRTGKGRGLPKKGRAVKCRTVNCRALSFLRCRKFGICIKTEFVCTKYF